MMLKETLVFALSLALGYVLCVLAKKQTSVIRTLGYTLGISIMVMTFAAALIASQTDNCWKGKPCGSGKMMKCMPMMKHRK